MIKKSIDKNLYAKVEQLMLAGMSQFQIVEELSSEYYDRKRVSDAVDRVIHPSEKEKILKQKKILCALATIVFLVNVTNSIYLTMDMSSEVLFSFFPILLFLESSFPLLIFIEYLPSMRNLKIIHSLYIALPTLFIIQCITSIMANNAHDLWFPVSKAISWLPIVILNIIWLLDSKKRK